MAKSPFNQKSATVEQMIITSFVNLVCDFKNEQIEDMRRKIGFCPLLHDVHWVQLAPRPGRACSILSFKVHFYKCQFCYLGDIKKVEKVRTMLREMLPIYLEFEVPRATFDASSTSPSTFSDLETKFGVQVRKSHRQ